LHQSVDAIVSTATLHWVGEHDRLWRQLARATIRPGQPEEIERLFGMRA
jgi:trans-aconitate methyltransferase